MILDGIKLYIAGVLVLLLAGALVTQTVRLNSEQTEHSALKLKDSQELQARTTAALKHETKTAASESLNAKSTQENSDAFTTSQPVRDAIARVDVARADRLRLDADRRAATYRAMSNSCAVAGISAADRLEALDKQLVAGVEVVGGLRKDLIRRDAEVVLLHGQLAADRQLSTVP